MKATIKADDPYNLMRMKLTKEEKRKFKEISRKENRSMSGMTTYLVQKLIKEYESAQQEAQL